MTLIQCVYGVCQSLLKDNKPAEDLCEAILVKHNLPPNKSVSDRKEILNLMSLIRKEVLVYTNNKIELLNQLNTSSSI